MRKEFELFMLKMEAVLIEDRQKISEKENKIKRKSDIKFFESIFDL